MGKFFTGLFTLFIAMTLMMPSAFAKDPVEGIWKTIDDETGKPKSIVKVYKASNGKMQAKILKLLNPSEPNPKCKQCTGRRKNKPIEGMIIMWGMEKDGSEWEGGTILDPKKGKTYDCKIWREGPNLMVRGYVAVFYRTQTWKPVKDPSKYLDK